MKSGLIPASIYFLISILCFYLSFCGLKTRELIFKKGTKGTGLENNQLLIWGQIIAVFMLGIVTLYFAIRHSRLS